MPEMQFAVGGCGIIVLRNRRFYCEIIGMQEDWVRFKFSLSEIPIEGMCATLEFYKEQGLVSYDAVVLSVSEEEGGQITFRYSINGMETVHRAWWRIPGDFAVQMRHHVHPGLQWAPVNDISLGGMQVQSRARLDEGDTLDLIFLLPGVSNPETVLAEVAHISSEYIDEVGTRNIGLRFLCLDAELRLRLKSYLWQRLRELHPADFAGRA